MKFRVTEELSKTLKTLRAQNGISSRDVAAYLGKSPSYVSKLEGGEIKFITEDMLTRLLTYISRGTDFYAEVLPAVVEVLRLVTSRESLRQQLWLMHYDVTGRPEVVPEGMAAEMAAVFAGAGATPESIAAQMNANIDSEMTGEYPANELVLAPCDDGERLAARVVIEPAQIEAILGQPGYTTSYFLLYNVAHTMTRTQLFPGVLTKLPPDDAGKVLRLTADFLNRWDVHSLMGFGHYVSSGDFIEQQMPLSEARGGVVDKIAAQLEELVGRDVLDTASRLDTWSETLAWDSAFALKIAGLPFARLGDLSYTNKARLLADIERLLDEYDQMDEFEKRIEHY